MSGDSVTDPRPAAKPFLFDATFDMAEAAKPDKTSGAPPSEPVFTPADIEQARSQGYAEGHTAGMAEANDNTERAATDTLRLIQESLERIGHLQTQANEAGQRETVALAMTILRKIMPTLAERHGLDEIEAFLSECLQHIRQQSRITVRVPEAAAGDIEQRLCDLIDGSAFDGRFTVEPDAAMAPGDCRIEWDDGGAERNSEQFWADIDAAVERFLEHGTSASIVPTVEPGDAVAPASGAAEEPGVAAGPDEAASEDAVVTGTPEPPMAPPEPSPAPDDTQ